LRGPFHVVSAVECATDFSPVIPYIESKVIRENLFDSVVKTCASNAYRYRTAPRCVKVPLNLPHFVFQRFQSRLERFGTVASARGLQFFDLAHGIM
jgi:hypothetical protein